MKNGAGRYPLCLKLLCAKILNNPDLGASSLGCALCAMRYPADLARGVWVNRSQLHSELRQVKACLFSFPHRTRPNLANHAPDAYVYFRGGVLGLVMDPPPRAPTNGRPGFPFGFLGAGGRLPHGTAWAGFVVFFVPLGGACPPSGARSRRRPLESAIHHHHKCGTSAAPVRHKCGTSAAQVRHQCGTSADQVRTKRGAQCGEQCGSCGTGAERRRTCGAASSD